MTLPVTLLLQQQREARMLLATQLRRRGLQVVEASSAGEACALAEVGHVDVVLATQMAADHDGDDLENCLKATPGAEHLPLVLLRSDGAMSLREATSSTTAVVPDTCDPDELIAVLTRVVAGAPRE